MKLFLFTLKQLLVDSTRKMRMENLNGILDYEAALKALDNLQSNADYIKNVAKNNGLAKPKQDNLSNIKDMEKYLKRTGLSLDDLDKLSVIHVSGTKGKGSTCAFTESILRAHGFTTGFFSSPHLLDVRERIQINGKPIGKQEFASVFFQIYKDLDRNKSSPLDMPLYFRYLTIMAFHVFLSHKVDVAIIEVGIGGEFDCTNVLRKTPVAGITSLGVDHTALLGDTLESIAWNKAGIMKSGTRAFTVTQPEVALQVLKNRSVERNSTLTIVDHTRPIGVNNSNLPPHIFQLNASLALKLSETWVEMQNKGGFSMDVARKAIEGCKWLGRFQTHDLGNIKYHLDGAHTVESLTVCADWFKQQSAPSERRVLIFNTTGQRNSHTFLEILFPCHFDTVIFVPNVVKALDNDNLESLTKMHEHKAIWLKLEQNANQSDVRIFPSITDAVRALAKCHESRVDVLVTGSLHLVGGVLSLLDPELQGILTE